MDAIAAVVIGGTSMSGGEGSMIGTLIGILISGIIANGLNLLGVAQGGTEDGQGSDHRDRGRHRRHPQEGFRIRKVSETERWRCLIMVSLKLQTDTESPISAKQTSRTKATNWGRKRSDKDRSGIRDHKAHASLIPGFREYLADCLNKPKTFVE